MYPDEPPSTYALVVMLPLRSTGTLGTFGPGHRYRPSVRAPQPGAGAMAGSGRPVPPVHGCCYRRWHRAGGAVAAGAREQRRRQAGWRWCPCRHSARRQSREVGIPGRVPLLVGGSARRRPPAWALPPRPAQMGSAASGASSVAQDDRPFPVAANGHRGRGGAAPVRAGFRPGAAGEAAGDSASSQKQSKPAGREYPPPADHPAPRPLLHTQAVRRRWRPGQIEPAIHDV